MSEQIESSFDAPESDAASYDGTETERELTIKLHGNRSVTLTFDLAEITPRVRREIGRMGENDQDAAEDAMIALLDSCVVKWDYVTRKGKHVDATTETIASGVSSRDLATIVGGLFREAQSPNADAPAS